MAFLALFWRFFEVGPFYIRDPKSAFSGPPAPDPPGNAFWAKISPRAEKTGLGAKIAQKRRKSDPDRVKFPLPREGEKIAQILD